MYKQMAAAGVKGKKADAAVKAAEEARDREEVRKLQRTLKREKRGAVRELRKDREAIVAATDKSKAVREGERAQKFKGLLQELESQAANANLLSGKTKAPRGQMAGSGGKPDKTTLEDKMPWLLSTGKKKADRRARKEGGGGQGGFKGGKGAKGGKSGKGKSF
jgi:hypothetical protein